MNECVNELFASCAGHTGKAGVPGENPDMGEDAN